MADQLLQGAKGDAGRDVESAIVQSTDLIMFNCVTRLGIMVPNRQRVAACGVRKTQQLLYVYPLEIFILMPIFLNVLL